MGVLSRRPATESPLQPQSISFAAAFGLGVAILSVALNNFFHTIVGRWEEDFQILKIIFMSVADQGKPAPQPKRVEI